MDRKGQTVLFQAAYRKEIGAIDELLENGADINAQDYSGRTHLIWCAQAPRPAAYKFLLNRSADIEIQDGTGMTAKDWAIKKNINWTFWGETPSALRIEHHDGELNYMQWPTI